METKVLERMRLFERLDKRERRRLAECAEEVDVAAGRRLATSGELAYEFFVIEDGTARVEVDGQEVGTLGPGDFFGEIGLLEAEHRRTATVTAATPMRLMVLTGADFRLLNRENSSVAEKVRAAMEERQRS